MSTINNVLSSLLYQLRLLTDLMLPGRLFLGDSERQTEREINMHIALGKNLKAFMIAGVTNCFCCRAFLMDNF